jgi:predicted polyphosphate/ATP-dependent NAD kinase
VKDVKIGFLVNPVAGMGGAVGLKGTDGVVEEAVRRGGRPVAGARAADCVKALSAGKGLVRLLTCSGRMGADLLAGFDCSVAYECGKDTSAQDTLKACAAFLEAGAGLILFCGGDGTARDVLSAVGEKAPVLGIPAGVKMHSSVFAVSPRAAGELALAYAGGDAGLREAEVVDVDEDAYRGNELRTRLFGYANTPYLPEMVQESKMVFVSGDDGESKRAIADFASEFMGDGSAYILGAGSTTKAIADRIGVEKTLLGVDVVKAGKAVLRDAGERELMGLLEGETKAKIIVSPIGAQGFVFGRGTQQISPGVIRRVGAGNVIYAATPSKLNATPHLLVDTGDAALDEELAGYRSVVIGYRMSQRKDVRAAGRRTS